MENIKETGKTRLILLRRSGPKCQRLESGHDRREQYNSPFAFGTIILLVNEGKQTHNQIPNIPCLDGDVFYFYFVFYL